jgi:hypothetical protein
MQSSLEVRQFLLQQDDTINRNSPTVPLQRGADPARISDEQVHRARMSVAHSALDADDCRLLLDMLGLVDSDDGVPPVRR